MTIEGERTTFPASARRRPPTTCTGLAQEQKLRWRWMMGDYGVFSGSRFRNDVVPMDLQSVSANA